jgi:hypothetical protein
VKSVELDVRGDTVEVLPNGHVLTTYTSASRVIEMDRAGKRVWEVAFPAPTAARRLPNGNTLIFSRDSGLVAELSEAGKEVWRYQADGRLVHVGWR